MAGPSISQQKLRVCFFIPDFCYGGAQKQCILLLNELQRRDDVELTLIRFRSGEQDRLLQNCRIRDKFVEADSNFDLRAIMNVSRLVSESQVDIILSWVRVCDIYSYYVRLLNPRIKWIMTQRNLGHADSALHRIRNFLGKRADAIVANSPGGVQWWEQRNSRGRVYFVDNIADPVQSVLQQRVARSVLFVGRLGPEKNVLTMIRAFALVAKTQSDLTIWVCGDGESRGEMEDIVAEAGVSERIKFLGFRSDAAEWMGRAKVLVSLSNSEGMPNVLMEGVQADCTIVASAITRHVDFLGAGYPFLVQNHHDAEEAARVITQALTSPRDSDALAYARQHLARMEPEMVAARYMEIFQTVMSQRAEGSRA